MKSEYVLLLEAREGGIPFLNRMQHQPPWFLPSVRYWQRAIQSPLRLLFPRLNSPGSFSLSS